MRFGTLLATAAVLAGTAAVVAPRAHADLCPLGSQYQRGDGLLFQQDGCYTPDRTFVGNGNPLPQPPPPPPPPHDAITMSYGAFSPGGGLPVTVVNSSSVPGSCTYDSTPFDFHQDFSVGANASTTFDIRGIPTATTYNVRVQCTGQFNGATVVIGQVNTTKQF